MTPTASDCCCPACIIPFCQLAVRVFTARQEVTLAVAHPYPCFLLGSHDITWLSLLLCDNSLVYNSQKHCYFFLLLKIQVYYFCILELLFALASQGFALTFFISIDFSSTLRHKVTGLVTANCLRLFIACVSVPLKTYPPI